MLNLIAIADELRSRVADADAVVEQIREPLHHDEGVLIDGNAERLAARLAIVLGIVGPASEETDAQRRPCDEHAR